jgi:hypothetical protein
MSSPKVADETKSPNTKKLMKVLIPNRIIGASSNENAAKGVLGRDKSP